MSNPLLPVTGDIAFTLSGGATFRTLTNAPVVDPGFTRYVQILDNNNGLCWEVNMIAQGASVQLQNCANSGTPAAFSQTFQLTSQASFDGGSGVVTGPKSTRLSMHYNATVDLCVYTNSKTPYLDFCRSADIWQTFDLSTPTFKSNKYCYSPQGSLNTLTRMSCTASDQYYLFYAQMPQYTVTPTVNRMTTSTGLCIDGANPSKVTAAKCSSSGSQQWYFHFGMIRNVFNGLCLDAPAADGSNDSGGSVTVQLTACNNFPPPPSQLWIRGANSFLYNGESGNCIRPKTVTSTLANIVLGTAQCSSRDSLKGYNAAIGGTSLFVMNANSVGSCTTPNQRKDLRDLTADQRTRFYNALNTLHSLPSMLGYPERFTDFGACHAIGGAIYHSTPYFPPWHRLYLRLFEQDLQTILGDSTFALPYWDWTVDHYDWWEPSTNILDSNDFGTSGLLSDGPDYCITDGFMANQWVPVDTGVCLSRQYDPTKNITDLGLYSEEMIIYMATVDPFAGTAYTTYDQFRQNLEGYPHNNFHSVVAGQGGQIGSVTTSALDPLFYMHHNNIDRIWQLFQLLQAQPGNTNSRGLQHAYDGVMAWPPRSPSLTRTVSSSDILPCFNVPVSPMLQYVTPTLCHVYQPFSQSIQSSYDEEASLNRLVSRDTPRKSEKKNQEYIRHLTEAAHYQGKRHPKSKCQTKKSRRSRAAPMTSAAIKRMGHFIKHSEAHQRHMEKLADKVYDELWKAVDEILEQTYHVGYDKATPAQHAYALKNAIGVLSKECSSRTPAATAAESSGPAIQTATQ